MKTLSHKQCLAVHSEETLHYIRLAIESECECQLIIASMPTLNQAWLDEVNEALSTLHKVRRKIESRFAKQNRKRKSK